MTTTALVEHVKSRGDGEIVQCWIAIGGAGRSSKNVQWDEGRLVIENEIDGSMEELSAEELIEKYGNGDIWHLY